MPSFVPDVGATVSHATLLEAVQEMFEVIVICIVEASDVGCQVEWERVMSETTFLDHLAQYVVLLLGTMLVPVI